MAQLLQQPTVKVVADRSGIPVALAALNVQRDVEYGSCSRSRPRTASTARKDYYFMASTATTGTASFDATFAMTDPTAVPYVADAWTGLLTPVANYTVTSGRLKTHINLKTGQTTILVFGHDSERLPHHATTTTADPVRADGKNLVARSATPGTYTTTLEDGRTVTHHDRTACRAALSLTQLDARRRRLDARRDRDRDRPRPAHAARSTA